MKPMFVKVPRKVKDSENNIFNSTFWKRGGLHRITKIEKTNHYKGDKLTVKLNTGGTITNPESWFTDQGMKIIHDFEVYTGIGVLVCGIAILVLVSMILNIW